MNMGVKMGGVERKSERQSGWRGLWWRVWPWADVMGDLIPCGMVFGGGSSSHDTLRAFCFSFELKAEFYPSCLIETPDIISFFDRFPKSKMPKRLATSLSPTTVLVPCGPSLIALVRVRVRLLVRRWRVGPSRGVGLVVLQDRFGRQVKRDVPHGGLVGPQDGPGPRAGG